MRRSGRHVFLEHDVFYNRLSLYDNKDGDFPDNPQRFVFLMRRTLKYLAQSGPPPDIIHTHD